MVGENEYYNNLVKVIRLTENNKIEWMRGSNSTYSAIVYNENGDSNNISIQKIESKKNEFTLNLKERIVFQIIRLVDKSVILSLDSSNSDRISKALKKLYETISYSVEKQSINYFNELLNSL